MLLTGSADAIEYSRSLLEKPCLLLTNGSGEVPCATRLVGLEGTVMLKPAAHGMVPEILQRKDPKSVSLARVLLRGDRDGDRIWVPVGLDVRYAVAEVATQC